MIGINFFLFTSRDDKKDAMAIGIKAWHKRLVCIYRNLERNYGIGITLKESGLEWFDNRRQQHKHQTSNKRLVILNIIINYPGFRPENTNFNSKHSIYAHSTSI